MIIRGLEAVSCYMGVSRECIRRWHTKYQDNTLNFPLIPIHTGFGNSIVFITSTELINTWLERLSAEDSKQARMNMRNHIKQSVCRKINQGMAVE